MEHLWTPSTITVKAVNNREEQPLGIRRNDNLIPKLSSSSEKENIKRQLAHNNVSF